MNLLDRARAQQNALERIVNEIPGFKGYREKELRRDADRLHREHLASRLERARKGLDDVAAAATRSGGLDAINDVETARKRLEKAVARVRYADRGYSGFFDAIKVDEDTLARVYAFDLALLQGIDRVIGAAERAPSAPDARATVTEMTAELDALDRSLADREAILGGIK
jgi:hypothetical protein